MTLLASSMVQFIGTQCIVSKPDFHGKGDHTAMSYVHTDGDDRGHGWHSGGGLRIGEGCGPSDDYPGGTAWSLQSVMSVG